MSLRKISIRGRYPFVRLRQLLDNPKFLFRWIANNFYYKRSLKDYSKFYKDFTFLSPEETLDELVVYGKSLARVNDGEFDQLSGIGEYPPDSDWSQKYSKELRVDMLKVLSSKEDNLCVAVTPDKYFLAKKDDDLGEPFDYNMWVYTKTFLHRFLNKGQSYGDCRLFVPFCSPGLDWKLLIDFLRSKIVIIATGNVSSLSDIRLGRENYYVECGKVNAYERKHDIKKMIDTVLSDNNIHKDDVVVLASLGPTAGILALEYLGEGITVWDTGHIFKHAQKKVKCL